MYNVCFIRPYTCQYVAQVFVRTETSLRLSVLLVVTPHIPRDACDVVAGRWRFLYICVSPPASLTCVLRTFTQHSCFVRTLFLPQSRRQIANLYLIAIVRVFCVSHILQLTYPSYYKTMSPPIMCFMLLVACHVLLL